MPIFVAEILMLILVPKASTTLHIDGLEMEKLCFTILVVGKGRSVVSGDQ